ncbi:3-methyl-2-oxobutanoate hydroxymethyltransferase [bacterium]|nr:3-methyl-2-oxobutanoate hydroxymethyltransferase [bacterium]
MSDFLVAHLRRKYRDGQPIHSITAYDYFTALLAAEAEMDFVLVGDSLANVIQGHGTTVPVSLDEMIYHTRIVARHFPARRVVIDMPFGSFKADTQETVRNCVRAFRESGCGAVKFEGANESNVEATRILTEMGVPVLAHLGLLPQQVNSEGGFRMQGKTEKAAKELLRQAKAMQEAGAFAVILECVVPEAAELITRELKIPTIGIGCGNVTSGQIIVVHDILGMLPGKAPSFAKQYADLFGTALAAVQQYRSEVGSREFPELGNDTATRERKKVLPAEHTPDRPAYLRS